MHDNFDLRQEQLNKSSLLSSKPFIETLLKELQSHIVSSSLLSHATIVSSLQQLSTGALVISALLDFFTFSLCPPYRYVIPVLTHVCTQHSVCANSTQHSV